MNDIAIRAARLLVPATVIAASALLLAAAGGCGGNAAGPGALSRGGVIQVKGSDTMVNLAQMWAEKYMDENRQTVIAVTGGGSGTGITAMINGTTDIATSSREMKGKEKDKAGDKGIEVVEHKVGLDGIAVIVHPSNPVSELSIDQLAGIFSGRITDWKDIGGEPGPIVVLSRESNSGTHVFFKEHVLNKGRSDGGVEFGADTLLLPSSQAIYDEAVQNPKTIGYVGLGYARDNVKALEVEKDEATPAVTPSVITVQNGDYPISRPLYMYTKKDAPQSVLDFLDWIKGSEGQQVVGDLEFVPLKSQENN